MKKKKRSSKKRLLAWLLVVAVTLGSIPNTATYYATDTENNSENSSSEGGLKSPVGDNSSPSVDNSKNNEAVQIQLVDSYNDSLIESVSDVTIRYKVVTEVESEAMEQSESETKWDKELTFSDSGNTTVENGVVTVLEANTVTVSEEAGKITKLYLQVEKSNYVTYETVVDLKVNSNGTDTTVEPTKIALNKQILIGDLTLTYSENDSGTAEEKILASINTKWKDFLTGKTVQYAVKKNVESATGTTEGITSWIDDLSTIKFSAVGKYEVFVKIPKTTNNENTTNSEQQEAVSYTAQTDENKEWIQSVVVEIKKAQIKDVSISAVEDLKYTEKAQELVTVNGLKAGDKVTWSVTSGENTQTFGEQEVTANGETLNCAIPTGTNPNTYTVGLTVNRGDNYEILTLDPVSVEIELAEITLEESSIIKLQDGKYNGSELSLITGVKNNDNYTLNYYLHSCETDECKCEITVEDGKWTRDYTSLKVTDAGFYHVWIKAERTNYVTKFIRVPITIAKKEINENAIAISKKDNLAYDATKTWSLVTLNEITNTDAQTFFDDTNSKLTWKVELQGQGESGETWTEVPSEVSDTDRTDLPTDCYVPGTYRVTLTIENKNYATFTTTVDNIVVEKGTLSVAEALTGYNGTYDGKEHFVLSLTEKERNYTLKYHLCDTTCFSTHTNETEFLANEEVWNENIPTVQNAGSYQVWVKAVKEHYDDVKVDVSVADDAKDKIQASCNVYIAPKSLNDIDIDDNKLTIVYDTTEQNIVTLTRDLYTAEETLADTTVTFKEEAMWTIKFKSLVDDATWETKLENVVSNEIPTYKIPGTYEVTLTIKGATKDANSTSDGWNYENYAEKTIKKTVTMKQGELDVSGLTVTGYSGIYDGIEHDAVIRKPESGYSYQLYYHLCNNECETHTAETILTETSLTWEENVPKVQNAGSYTIWVKAVEQYYNDKNVIVTEGEGAIAPYNIYIEKADQPLTFISKEYGDNANSKVTISQTAPFNNITYNFSAVVEEGKTSLTTSTISYFVKEQTKDGENTTLIETTKAVIDENGKLIVTEPGTYVIIATLAADANCNGDTISHTLIVSATPADTGDFVVFKDENGFKVETKEYVFQAVNKVISELKASVINANDNGTITYKIDKTDIGIACDSNNGTITVTNYEILAGALKTANGSVTVTVTATKAAKVDFAGNVVFEEDSTSYQLVIEFADLPTDFQLDDWVSDPNGTNSWYNTKDALTVTVPEGYENYTISTKYDGTFDTSVTFSDEGQNERIIYLKNADGEITAPIKLVDANNDNLKIDTIAPTTDNMTISYSELSWIEKLGKKFGFYDPSVTITFTVTDEIAKTESGLASIKWTYTKEENASDSILGTKSDVISVDSMTEDENGYTATLTLTASEAEQYRGHISFTATDKAGNTSDEKTDEGNIIVLDTINPRLQVKYGLADETDNVYTKADNAHYYSDDVEFTFIVTEANFFEEDIVISVSKDGADAQPLASGEIEWTAKGNDIYHGTFTLSKEGKYVVSMKYLNGESSQDNSNNPMVDDTTGKELSMYTSETIIIDKTNPEMKFSYDKSTQTTTFTVKEHNFRPKHISVTGSIKDVNGNVIKLNEEEFTAEKLTSVLQNAKWIETDTDVWTYTFDYKQNNVSLDGIYDLTIEYKDFVTRTVTCEPENFIIDHTKPEICVEYNEPAREFEEVSYYSINEKVEKKNPLEVTITIKEQNFVKEDVIVSVTRDETEVSKPTVEWTTTSNDKNVHIGTFTLENDGHYDIQVTYTDSFENIMPSYELVDALVIDSTPSVIDVTYTNGKVVNELKDSKEYTRKYFSESQTVVITVEERNFNKDEFEVTLTANAHDLDGTVLDNTNNQVYEVLEWKKGKQENTHILEIKCNADANYSLDIAYQDLATNETLKKDYFTVDTTAPDTDNLIITYPETTFIEKLINGVKELFGFHGSDDTTVTVVFTADDATAGIQSFEWKTDMDSEEEWEVVEAVVDSKNPNQYTAEITLPKTEEVEQLRAHVQVVAIDKSGNESNVKDDVGRNIVVDTISPTLKINHMLKEETGNYNLVDGIHYYSEDVAFTFIIEETNFFPEDVSLFVSRDGGKAELLESDNVTWVNYYGSEEIYYGTFILSGDGDYVVSMKYLDDEKNQDNSGNVMTDAETGAEVTTYQSDVITIDTINPELEFSYDKETQSTTFTVKEHNFRLEDIRIDATSLIVDVNGNAMKYTDVNGETNTFTVEELEVLLQTATWTQTKDKDGNTTDIYTYTFDYQENGVSLDGIYDLKLDYTDLALRDAKSCEPENFIIDRTPATNVSIAYETPLFEKILEKITLGFYNPTVTVTFTAYDAYAGLESFSWNYIKSDGASSVNRPTDEKATVVKAVQDEKDKSKYTATIVLSDKEAEELRQLEQMHGYLSVFTTDKYQNQSAKISDDGRVFIVDTISPTMKVEYSLQDTKSDDETIAYYQGDAEVTFYVNEANFYEENVKVMLSKDSAEATPITVAWTDVNVDEHIGKYTISGDGDYVLSVTYSDYSGNVMVDAETEAEMETYQSHIITIDTINPILDFTFNESEQTTTFIVKEHNFHPKDIVVKGTRKDLNDNDLSFENIGLTELLQNAEWKQNGDTYTYTFDYKENNASFDGIYNLTLDYIDLSDRVAQTHQPETFTIDRAVSSNVEFSYSKSILDTILETVTLGFYNPSVTVTLTSYDKYIGVDYFEWQYIRQKDASESNRATDIGVTQIKAVQDKQDKSKFTAIFELPNTDAKQLRGYLAATATDKYKNKSQNVNDAGRVVVVDTISPTISVEYSDADRVVGETSYYNNDVIVTFIVNEANFFAEDVNVSVSKDGGKLYTLKTDWSDLTTDVHVGTCKLSGDGDYVITVNYTDRSLNQMKTYTSHVLTIDMIRPVIDVTYQNQNVINTLTDSEEQEREYFADTQTAVVTVTEHNFNAEEVEISIIAKDVTGAELDAEKLHMKTEWKDGAEEDTHVAVLTYSGDANYTFDVAYTDLATNVADDYAQDYFTVDNTAPVNLKTEYSTSLLETILEAITFGFYNAKVTVTLTAEDETSGVHEFHYSYINAEGVSGVNAELINQAITASEIVYSDDRKTATVTFTIPKDVLTDSNQFNGTVSFEATDRAGIKNTLDDNRRIVVDNIAPTAQVTYNEPVNMEGTISYYDGDVQATVVINEANFYAEDVVVTVLKDGGASYAVTPSWTNNSADVHTGTFTLSEDGDYFITITYHDKSSNEMAVYTSEQLTIDTDIEAPTILFNGNSENGQAYKGEIVPSISFTDVNFDSFEVHLYRTYKGARDVEITEEKELNGFFSISEQNGDATFNIFGIGDDGKYNPNDDGIYHLVITMNDKSRHTVDSEAYFTVNRYGSVYEYSEYLSSLIADGGAYVMAVTEDLVITEYNADRLVSESLDIEITRDGKPLDTVNYSVSPAINEYVAVGESGWFQYEYTISKDNFTEDGIYKISISSKDATGNAPENNNFEDKNIRFYVDSTVPEITSVTGLEESVVDSTQLTIRYMVFDVVGLKSVKIYVDGAILEEITDFGEEFNHYEGNFTLEESENKRSVRIVVEDLAGNITDTDSKDFTSAYVFNKEVMVTTNAVARLLANEELVTGVLIGAVALATVTGVGIFLKRKKKVVEE